MTLHETIETNADLVLGADEVLPMETHEAAVEHARDLNHAVFTSMVFNKRENDVLCFAYASPWPHTEESHEESMLAARSGDQT